MTALPERVTEMVPVGNLMRINHYVKWPDLIVQFKWTWERTGPSGWGQHALEAEARNLGWHVPFSPRPDKHDCEHCDHGREGFPYYGTDLECDLFPSGRCYYDGSTSNADTVLDILLSKGDKAMWQYLLEYGYELRKEFS